MNILRVGLVTLMLVLLGAGAVAVGVALDSGVKAEPQRSVGPGREAPQSKALSPQQQKKVDEARKQFLAERKEYAKLRAAGAPEKQLAAQRAKVEKAGAALRALGVEAMPRRMAGGGCGGAGGGSCSHGAKGEGKGGGCSMGAKGGGCSGEGGGGGCSMGAKAKSPSHNTAKGQEAARAGQAGKSASQASGQTSHAGHATGHGGAAVERGGDAAGHDGGHSGHGSAAKAQGV